MRETERMTRRGCKNAVSQEESKVACCRRTLVDSHSHDAARNGQLM